MTKDNVAVAFSGGLDTSWLVARFAEEGHRVTAITVNTGGWEQAGLDEVAAHAKALGAIEHVAVDGRDALYDDHIAWLIRGNVLRGHVYPLCVGVERVVQARLFAEAARSREIRTLIHGSTGAGNDQIRFDVALRCVAPEAKVLAPIRDEARTREETFAWLLARGKAPLQKDALVSINAGLWGVTAGGRETHDAWVAPTEASFTTTAAPEAAPSEGADLVLAFEAGLPVAVDGERIQGWRAVSFLAHLAGQHGVGRGIHLGDTILGIKGRVAFEAPAASVILPAHRELEKLVLTAQQRFWKDHLGELYGQLVHEARYHDPLCRDIEAFLGSSQARVSGEVRVHLRQGAVMVTGVRSPWSLMDVQQTAYGEKTSLWSGEDARGYARIHGTAQWMASVAAFHGEEGKH
jgi:argininosuccinate synthase